jgi:predicted nucleic acid-binding protein
LSNPLVLDASAAVPLVITGVLPAELASYELQAPPLLWSEVTSTIRQLVVRADLSEHAASVALSRLVRSTIERVSPDGLHAQALDIAGKLGWAKTYDAEYVALARALDAPLLTRDERLRRGARRLVSFYTPDA